jgi:anti-anti-sigma factor
VASTIPPRPNASLELAGPGTCVLALLGEWDIANADELRDLLDASVGRYPRVVLDLSRVVFADSTIVALTVRAQHRQREGGGELRLVVGPGVVDLLLRATGLRGMFAVFETRAAALA